MDPRTDNIGFMMRKINFALIRRFNRNLQELDITVPQVQVLKYLNWHENETVTQKDIEEYLGVSHPTTVGLLKRMEAKDLIQTELRKEKKQVKVVILTDKARKLDREMKKRHMESEKILSIGFSEEEKELLKKLLQRLSENLQQDIPETECMGKMKDISPNRGTQKYGH